jgi:hypothetical protein
MGSHDPFAHLKHKLWPKEKSGVKLAIRKSCQFLTLNGRESNCQFDSRPLKVRNRPNFLMCTWCATYCWKDLNKSYNFVLDFISIGGLHTKLWGPKITRVPTLAISGLPLGSPETKSHLDVGLVERHKVYYKGEGDGFPQVRAVVSLVNSNLPVACPNTKSAPTMH